jgi:hypothetical protein
MIQSKAIESAKEASRRYVEARLAARKLKVPNHPQIPQIDHDRSLPVQTRGGVRKFDHFYPFERMKPGDSFWVPSDTQCTAGAMTKFSQKSGWKFVSRGQAQDGRPNGQVGRKLRGTRVWRIS